MALKKYNVTVNRQATVLQLDAKDAKARGLTDKDLVDYAATDAANKKAVAAANKSATPANKSGTPANK